jgi:uncharacterized membrane protein
MKKLIGVFLMLIFLSGCIVTASSGTRTEYEDKMKTIERDYKAKKITKEEYTKLKNEASQQGEVGKEDGSTGSGQRYP